MENFETKEQIEKYIKNISSFDDWTNLKSEDLRLISYLIDSYKKEKTAEEREEKLKNKLTIFFSTYFNNSMMGAKEISDFFLFDNDSDVVEELRYDFSTILEQKSKKERNKTIEDIKDLFKTVLNLTDDDFKEVLNRLEISDDWEKSLRKIPSHKLANKLSYCFSIYELKGLINLHKNTTKKNVRKRIEDLLNYCNFHYEAGELTDGNYKKLLDELNKEEEKQNKNC